MAKKRELKSRLNTEDDHSAPKFRSKMEENVTPIVKKMVYYDKIELDRLISAPKEWNFYKLPPEDKINELYFSIKDTGMNVDIIVWEQENGEYMILAGHTRKYIYELLLENEGEEYNKINCKIYPYSFLNDKKAQQIIINTNWVQRDLSRIERISSIIRYYELITDDNYQGTKREIREIISKDLEISVRQVSAYYSLRKLNSQFMELIENDKLSIENGSKLAQFDEHLQEYIIANFKRKLKHKYISKLKSDMTKTEIEKCFKDNKISSRKNFETTFKTRLKKIPDDSIGKLKKHINEWLVTEGYDQI